ncbi:MAG: PBP1A family penicillin-binding protein [Acidimicrobiia bacterium]
MRLTVSRADSKTMAFGRRLVALGIVGVVLGGCAYRSNLPDAPRQAETSAIYAADGSLITQLSSQNRQPVTLDQIAPVMRDAIVAIEDARFYDHPGVDPRALARALSRNYESGRVAQGGSTITQQLVRNLLLDDSRSISRKLREAALANEYEKRFTKRQILEKYLNAIYFGNGAYGIESAARTYFDTTAAALNLEQAAFLAGIVQGPERLNPYVHPIEAKARRDTVLDAMAQQGYIEAPAAAQAIATPLGVAPPKPPARYIAGHFVERVKDLILGSSLFGETLEARRRSLLEGGLRIETTLDPVLQQKAEESINDTLNRDGDPSGSLVSIDAATGAVRAYVGGPDFFGDSPNAKFDLAGQGGRQSGSAFKPYVLAAALEKGFKLDQSYDAPGRIVLNTSEGPWDVRNYDGSGRGRLNLVDATVNSVNTVYAQLVLDVGPENVTALANRIGVKTPLQAFPSSALGTNSVTVMDMASAYTTFANDGMHADPYFVSRVYRRDGTLLYEAPKITKRVLDKNVARQVDDVLSQVVARGTGTRAQLGRPMAGKTGTAEEWRDAWFCGFTPQLVTAVWVGFPDEERSMTPPTTRITVAGATWPAQIWRSFMAQAVSLLPPDGFPAPEIAPVAPATTAAPTPVLPDFTNLDLAAAQRLATSAGVTLDVVTAPRADIPGGKIAEQDPGANTIAARGTRVRVVVSSGPPVPVAIPNVIGLLPDEAVYVLARAGFVTNLVTEHNPDGVTNNAIGRVWRQDPGGGELAGQGTKVTLTVNPPGS